MEFKEHLEYLKDTKYLKYYLSKEHFIAIDIGTHSVKLMEIKRVGPEYSIEKAIHIPEVQQYFKDKDIDDLAGIIENITHIIDVENIKAKDIFLTFASSRLQTKIVQIPEVDEKELPRYIEIEYQKKFPSHNRLNNIADFMSLGSFEASELTHKMVLMALLPISEATSIVREFQKKKFRVQVIDVDIHSTTNVANIMEREHADRAILDIGRKNSRIIFMRDEVPVFHREFVFGLNHISKILQEKLSISMSDAEFLLDEYGMNVEEDILYKNKRIKKGEYNAAIESNFMDVFSEVFRSFQYVFSSYGIEAKEMLLTSGLSSLKNSAETLTKIFDIPTRATGIEKGKTLNLPDGCVIKNNTKDDVTGAFTNCLGMAVRGSF